MWWLVLGLVLGLAAGAGAVAAIVRATGRVTGTGPRQVGSLIVGGLLPGRRADDGVAAQRALARRLRSAASRTASGHRVAAAALTVHVSPEDHGSIAATLGVDQAERDLAEFYAARAERQRWIVAAPAEVRLVRDISLRPRQAFVRAAYRAAPEAQAGHAATERAEWTGAERAATEPRAEPHRAPVADRRPPVAPRADERTTDVLPSSLLEKAYPTAAYPPDLLLGDLVVVHGTDVRTVPPSAGALRIGRGAQNDLVLEAPGIGRDHLVVEVRGGAWWVVPGTSEGGTVKDGRPVEAPFELAEPATLDLGLGVRLRLSVADPLAP